MASPKTWLELRSGAPGLSGPFLLENLSALQCFDYDNMNCRPSLIITIGHHHKSCFLEDVFHVYSHGTLDTIQIQSLPAADGCILLDCQLHQQNAFQRVKAGPQPANLILHELKTRPENAEKIAYGLYSQVFSSFADLALVFVSDFGGITNVIKFLCFWAKDGSDHLSASAPSTVVLVNDEGSNVHTVKDVYFRLATSLLQDLNALDPTRAHTISQADARVRRYLQVHILPHYASSTRLRRSFSDILRQASLKKKRLRLDFSAKHLKVLLRSALVHFAAHPNAPFTTSLAARVNNPIPINLQYHLVDFLRCASLVGVTGTPSMAQLIAAALLLDAYPPGFFPATLFENYYADQLALVEKMSQTSGLRHMTKQSFICRANRLLSEATDCATAHLSFLKAASLGTVRCSRTCIFCMVRPPIHTLECRHRLCSSCVVICGREADPWTFRVLRCPLCQVLNEVVFFVRPTTAGLRVLSLTGSRPTDTWDFLKSLRGHIHLVTMAFRDYFDVVVASESGIFFALTLFSDWTLSDCKHHLPKLRPPRFSKAGQIIFAKGLRWDLNAARYANSIGYIILGRKDGIFSNFIVTRNLGRST
ncbi:hypothetical protein F5B17DRAFT_264505 [Nemania serpens]|nr:hypothetical protein F5B17DRAFT_264505 [Nemania serpens]